MGPIHKGKPGATAIVLAAGESRRMGTLKPLLPFGSSSVIRTAVRSLKASPVSSVLVVLGHRSEKIAAELAGEDVRLVINPRYPEGMLTSIQAGIAAADPETEWLVIALGDQPWVRPELVEHLLDEAHTGLVEGQTIVVPSYCGRRGHPLVLHRRRREEIAALDPEVGLRQLMQRSPEHIRHVVVPEEDVLLDMDTPEDYRNRLERLAGASGT
jgi:molybdenum cofactor cytidylyltransferase